VARTKDPAVRTLLVERAATMLRAREPLTLRSLVAGTGVSTMAVYTHFGGMDGLWKALRQEGFTRLAARFEGFSPSNDAVRDLTVCVAGYVANALDHPDLYRVMFDASVDLEDLSAADATLEELVQCVHRARQQGRFRDDVDAPGLATQTWIVAHGLASLVAGGPLPVGTLDHAVPMLVALFTAAGDDSGRSETSVRAGWAPILP
jgi:AcrR family transcriptional regulator